MRYLAFAGVIGDSKFHPGGWNDVLGGGDEVPGTAKAAADQAKALHESFTNPDVRYNVRCWWHVADTETGQIVAEGEFPATAAVKGWLMNKKENK